jgi:hypothetical protein
MVTYTTNVRVNASPGKERPVGDGAERLGRGVFVGRVDIYRD